jgi:hypothetical protein
MDLRNAGILPHHNTQDHELNLHRRENLKFPHVSPISVWLTKATKSLSLYSNCM